MKIYKTLNNNISLIKIKLLKHKLQITNIMIKTRKMIKKYKVKMMKVIFYLN